MAEQGLDGAKIGSVHEEIGGEGMAQCMRADVFSDAGHAGVFFDDAFDGAGSQTAIISGCINGI